MYRLVLLLLLLSPVYAQRVYQWSVGAQVAAQGLDIQSSWGGIESNSVLGRGQQYGWKATAIKSGVFVGCMLVQRWAVKKNHNAYKAAAIVNFGMAGATTGVAIRNWRVR